MADANKDHVTIALFWHSLSAGNLGVGALTVANIEILRSAAAQAGKTAMFVVLGWREPRDTYDVTDDVALVPLRTRYLPAPGGPVGQALREADLVVDIGGGDSFTSIYGSKRFLTIWLTKLRAKLAGLPLILAPQTIGPFDTQSSRWLARWIMNRCDLIASRDAKSTAFLAEMGVSSPIVEATDVAMRLPYQTPPERPDGAPLRVGLNVSGLLFNGGYTGKNEFALKADYAALCREIIARFQRVEGVEVHLVGHVFADHMPVEDDLAACRILAEEFPGAVLAPEFASPSEAKSYIAGMDFFMGARMHATIAAFSSGVPVVPMAYSRKFAGVFGTLGYHRVADCREDDREVVLSKIDDAFRARDQVKVEIARALEQVDSRLDAYRDAIAAIIWRRDRAD